MLDPCVDELLVLLGYACLSHPGNTSMVRIGLAEPLIKCLVRLPFEYFCTPRYQNVLFPTLIILCAQPQAEVNQMIVESEMFIFIQATKDGKLPKNVDPRMSFTSRMTPSFIDESMAIFNPINLSCD